MDKGISHLFLIAIAILSFVIVLGYASCKPGADAAAELAIPIICMIAVLGLFEYFGRAGDEKESDDEDLDPNMTGR